MNSLFADRLTNVQIAGNTVRMEFSTLELLPGNDQTNPKTSVSLVLVMPLDGFVQAYNGQEAVVRKLLADGLLRRNEPTPTA